MFALYWYLFEFNYCEKRRGGYHIPRLVVTAKAELELLHELSHSMSYKKLKLDENMIRLLGILDNVISQSPVNRFVYLGRYGGECWIMQTTVN